MTNFPRVVVIGASASEVETVRTIVGGLPDDLAEPICMVVHTAPQSAGVVDVILARSGSDAANLIHTTEIATVFLDRALRIKLFTPGAREIFDLNPTDRGRTLSEVSGTIDIAALRDDIARVLDRAERVEREVRSRDGRWHLMQVMPYRSPDERIDDVVVTFVDISRQKESADRITRSEAQVRLLLESITDHAIITIDANTQILEWNVGAERLFGYSAEEVIGQSAAVIFTPEDRAREAHLEEVRIAQSRGRAMDERWHLRKDGTRFYVSGVLSPIGPTPATTFVKVARDLTERKRSEEALQQAHDELESAVARRTAELRDLFNRLVTVQEDERRRIARDLHDDIGQKMTALHLKLEALRRGHADGSRLRAQVEEAQAFVKQLDKDLDFLTWELRPAALYDLGLGQALRDFISEWSRNYDIAATFQEIGLSGERLRADQEVNLYRIAQEALNNVHKHARARNVEVVLQRRDSDIVLTIEDDGVGMTRDDSGHHGMGLVNIRERAALMKGVVEFERSESGGTTVIVCAPALQSELPTSASDGKSSH